MLSYKYFACLVLSHLRRVSIPHLPTRVYTVSGNPYVGDQPVAITFAFVREHRKARVPIYDQRRFEHVIPKTMRTWNLMFNGASKRII